MTLLRLPTEPTFASLDRRGGGSGEPAPHPVAPPADHGEPWLIDSREVARLLGVSRTKAFQMMGRNELPVVRIGRCVRVSRAELSLWISDRAKETLADWRGYAERLLR